MTSDYKFLAAHSALAFCFAASLTGCAWVLWELLTANPYPVPAILWVAFCMPLIGVLYFVYHGVALCRAALRGINWFEMRVKFFTKILQTKPKGGQDA